MNIRETTIIFVLAGFSSMAVYSAEHPGKKIYESSCASCHSTGALNAPKINQTPKWRRIERKGFNEVVGNTLVGVGSMPAKGGKADLSDMQVAQAVHYLMITSLARIPEPTEANVRAARAEGEKLAARRAAAKK